MTLPDDDFEDADDIGYDAEEDDIDTDDVEALVWNLLLLINPGDEETALRQFALYRDAIAQGDADAEEPQWALKDAIDWTSGFYVDWKDTETFVDVINELVKRWNLDIDWGGDISDEEFLDRTDVPTLMAVAYDRLREHGYSLWTWDTGSDSHAGWIALSRDDEGMQQLCQILGIEVRPGSDAF